MPRNIEIKARIDSVESYSQRLATLADTGPTKIFQDDTFFACENGRMKLRALSKDKGELIFYRRANQTGAKESFYLRSPTTSPDSLRDALSQAYGQAGRVLKIRILFMIGRTRVHLDRVRHLGQFIELEVVLQEDESEANGAREAEGIMRQLGIAPSQWVEGAYVDLLFPSMA